MRIWIIIGAILIIGNLSSQSLSHKVDDILRDEVFDHASVGLSVRSLNGNEVISKNSDKKLIPASSQKLITTLTALDILGSEYRFKTRVGYSGSIDDDGTLNGDIVIIGGGDPTLGSARFGPENNWETILEKILRAIKDYGISCVAGVVEVRTNVFDDQAIGDNWPYADIANYYASGAWAINFNENSYKLDFVPGEEGRVAKIKTIRPSIPWLSIESRVVIKGPKSGDHAYIYGDPYLFDKVVRGTIPWTKKGFTIKGAIPNPPLVFAEIISQKLKNIGIPNQGCRIVEIPVKKSDFQEIFILESPILGDIIKEANYESINLYCESIFKLMAKKVYKEGSFDKGVKVLQEALIKADIPAKTFHIEDGSGLSPRNTITPASFTKFLVFKAKTNGEKGTLPYIPRTGKTGTVKGMLKNKKSQTHYFLKSGSMGGVLSYTGYFKSKSGKPYAFCFISNNHEKKHATIRRKVEEICELLYGSL